jgi:hypothetical protein
MLLQIYLELIKMDSSHALASHHKLQELVIWCDMQKITTASQQMAAKDSVKE